MNLALDFGNSFVKLGLFEGDKLRFTESHHKLSVNHLKFLLRKYPVDAACVSSVTNSHLVIESFLKRETTLVTLSHHLTLPFKNDYQTPATLGNDRRANVMGGISLFPGRNILIISAGTCITYDLVTSEKEYLGGNISPGLEMRLKAMHTFTARLPLVRKTTTTHLIGRTTSESMLTGAIKGAAHEMEGFISEYKKEFRSLRILITGGDATVFESHLEKKIFAVPNLTLIGLNQILNTKK